MPRQLVKPHQQPHKTQCVGAAACVQIVMERLRLVLRHAPCSHSLVAQHGCVPIPNGQTVVGQIVNCGRQHVLDRRESVEVGVSDVLLDDFLL